MSYAGQADLNGAPTAPTSTSSATQTKSSKTSAVVGGIVGALAFILLVGLLLCFIIRRHRRKVQATPAIPTHHLPSATAPPMRQAATSPYLTSAYDSLRGLSGTSLHLISPTSPANTVTLSPPITDAADMITPFLASPTRRFPGSSMGVEAVSGGRSSQPPPVPPRSRMNPPPYSPTTPGEGSSGHSALLSPTSPQNLSRRRSAKHLKHMASGSMESTNSTMPASVEGGRALSPTLPPPVQSRQTHDPRPRGVRLLSADSKESNDSTATLNSAGHTGGSAHLHDVKSGLKGSNPPRKSRPAV